MTASVLVSRRRLLTGTAAGGVAVLTAGLAAACSAASATPVPMTVHKDPNCGCCTAWADRMAADGRFAPTIVEDADMAAVKTRLRVPAELVSCHTTEVGSYVIEGHVPAGDVARLLAERPAGIIGLAVPGMPTGSPGMEVPDGTRDPYEVVAFTADGRQRVFARHT